MTDPVTEHGPPSSEPGDQDGQRQPDEQDEKHPESLAPVEAMLSVEAYEKWTDQYAEEQFFEGFEFDTKIKQRWVELEPHPTDWDMTNRVTNRVFNLLIESHNKKQDYRAARCIIEILALAINKSAKSRVVAREIIKTTHRRLVETATIYGHVDFLENLMGYGIFQLEEEEETWEDAKKTIFEIKSALDYETWERFRTTMYMNACIELLYDSRTALVLDRAATLLEYWERYRDCWQSLVNQAKLEMAEERADMKTLNARLVEIIKDDRVIAHLWRQRLDLKRSLERRVSRLTKRFDDYIDKLKIRYPDYVKSQPENPLLWKDGAWDEYVMHRKKRSIILPITGHSLSRGCLHQYVPLSRRTTTILAIDPSTDDISSSKYGSEPGDGLDPDEGIVRRANKQESHNKNLALYFGTARPKTEVIVKKEGSVDSVEKVVVTIMEHSIPDSFDPFAPLKKFLREVQERRNHHLKYRGSTGLDILKVWFAKSRLAKDELKIFIINQPAYMQLFESDGELPPLGKLRPDLGSAAGSQQYSRPELRYEDEIHLQNEMFNRWIEDPKATSRFLRRLGLVATASGFNLHWSEETKQRVRSGGNTQTGPMIEKLWDPNQPFGADPKAIERFHQRRAERHRFRAHNNARAVRFPQWGENTLRFLKDPTPKLPTKHYRTHERNIRVIDQRFTEHVELPRTHYIPQLLDQIIEILQHPDNIRHYAIILRAGEKGSFATEDKILAEPGPTALEIVNLTRLLDQFPPNFVIQDPIWDDHGAYGYHQRETVYPEWIHISGENFNVLEDGVHNNQPISIYALLLFTTVAHELAHYIGTIANGWEFNTPHGLWMFGSDSSTRAGETTFAEMGDVIEWMIFGANFGLSFNFYSHIERKPRMTVRFAGSRRLDRYPDRGTYIYDMHACAILKNLNPVKRLTAREWDIFTRPFGHPISEFEAIWRKLNALGSTAPDLSAMPTKPEEIPDVEATIAGRKPVDIADRHRIRKREEITKNEELDAKRQKTPSGPIPRPGDTPDPSGKENPANPYEGRRPPGPKSRLADPSVDPRKYKRVMTDVDHAWSFNANVIQQIEKTRKSPGWHWGETLVQAVLGFGLVLVVTGQFYLHPAVGRVPPLSIDLNRVIPGSWEVALLTLLCLVPVCVPAGWRLIRRKLRALMADPNWEQTAVGYLETPDMPEWYKMEVEKIRKSLKKDGDDGPGGGSGGDDDDDDDGEGRGRRWR